MKKTVLSGAAGLALSATMLSAYADIITANYNPLPSQVRLSDPVTASLQFSDAATGVINATKTDAITSADGASVIYTTKTNVCDPGGVLPHHRRQHAPDFGQL